MIEDELLKWKFKRGSQDALQRIYEKYLNYLITLAMALSNDAGTAQDVVHDVFVSFAQSASSFKLRGNLKAYLAICVINRARDQIRSRQRSKLGLSQSGLAETDAKDPEELVIGSEEARLLNKTIAQLPQDQRETIVLHLKGEMKFTEIAKLQGVSVNTILGRYRYGLRKLRSILNGEVEK
jgi:RNA polymerase sigma-70 factor (ECF subfamily)